jgi:hypothetical protein
MFGTAGVQSRSDIDYARELVSLLPSEKDSTAWSPYGWCERPKVDIFVSALQLLRLIQVL